MKAPRVGDRSRPARPWARVEVYVADVLLTGEEIDAGAPRWPTLEGVLRPAARLWISRRELARHAFATWPRAARRRRDPGRKRGAP